jgi:4-hydroxybenzoate polyprenyltransferase
LRPRNENAGPEGPAFELGRGEAYFFFAAFLAVFFGAAAFFGAAFFAVFFAAAIVHLPG